MGNEGVAVESTVLDPPLTPPFQGGEQIGHVAGSAPPPARGRLGGGPVCKGEPLLIEGYAAWFGLPDSVGDVVRAGAFARSLRSGARPPMLLMHRGGAIVGRWTRMIEDGRGLYLRGLVEAASARALVAEGMSGLSIGFRPRIWKARGETGRELIDVELVEVSLVRRPMQGRARFGVVA